MNAYSLLEAPSFRVGSTQFISGITKNPRYERFLGYARPLADSQRSLRLWMKPSSDLGAGNDHVRSS